MQLLIPLALPILDSNTSGTPIELEEFSGKMTLEYAAKPFLKSKKIDKIIVVIHSETDRRTGLSKVLKRVFKNNLVIKLIHNFTKGATCTSLMALDEISMNDPLIITSLDQILDVKIDEVLEKFTQSEDHGGIINFNSINPKWSYAVIENNLVKQTAEKSLISNQAIAGFYFFKSGFIFKEAAFKQILKRNNPNEKNYFISEIFNEIIVGGFNVNSFKILPENYIKILSKDSLLFYAINKNKSDDISYHLNNLTRKYVEYFNSKDIINLKKLLSEKALLEEVSKNKFEGREKVLKMLAHLFENNTEVKLDIINIEVSQRTQTAFLEFRLKIGRVSYEGIDIINWDKDLITRIKAYFFEIKP